MHEFTGVLLLAYPGYLDQFIWVNFGWPFCFFLFAFVKIPSFSIALCRVWCSLLFTITPFLRGFFFLPEYTFVFCPAHWVSRVLPRLCGMFFCSKYHFGSFISLCEVMTFVLALWWFYLLKRLDQLWLPHVPCRLAIFSCPILWLLFLYLLISTQVKWIKIINQSTSCWHWANYSFLPVALVQLSKHPLYFQNSQCVCQKFPSVPLLPGFSSRGSWGVLQPLQAIFGQ